MKEHYRLENAKQLAWAAAATAAIAGAGLLYLNKPTSNSQTCNSFKNVIMEEGLGIDNLEQRTTLIGTSVKRISNYVLLTDGDNPSIALYQKDHKTRDEFILFFTKKASFLDEGADCRFDEAEVQPGTQGQKEYDEQIREIIKHYQTPLSRA